jgi:hypothetical protein
MMLNWKKDESLWILMQQWLVGLGVFGNLGLDLDRDRLLDVRYASDAYRHTVIVLFVLASEVKLLSR